MKNAQDVTWTMWFKNFQRTNGQNAMAIYVEVIAYVQCLMLLQQHFFLIKIHLDFTTTEFYDVPNFEWQSFQRPDNSLLQTFLIVIDLSVIIYEKAAENEITSNSTSCATLGDMSLW